jgi:hypothetical protein
MGINRSAYLLQRFGSPDDFRLLWSDAFHQAGAVIIDWVTAHFFPKTEHECGILCTLRTQSAQGIQIFDL